MRSALRRLLATGLVLLVGALAPPEARAAATGFALEGLEPLAAPGRHLINISESTLLTHLDLAVAVAAHYSGETLTASAGAPALVGDRLTLEPSLALGLWDIASLAVSVPIITSQEGSLTTDGGLGDLRVTPRLRLVNPAWAGGLGVHLSVPVFLPSGDPATFTGEGTLRARPTLGLDWRHRRSGLALALNVGWDLRPTRRVDEIESSAGLRWSAGVELPTGRGAHFIALAFGRIRAGERVAAGEPAFPTEALGGLAISATRRVTLTLAGGGALVADRQTPKVRFVVSLGYRFLYDRDSDRDGFLEGEDQCPELAEDYDGFEDDDGCPEEDNDGDGLVDGDDLCPEQAEDRDGFEDDDGCPDLDNDRDGVKDGDDQCPGVPEDRDGFEDDDGCPDPDNDGDGILDIDDRCPDEPEDFDGLGDEDGCFEVDLDGDGFYDSEDFCPEQPEDFDGVEDDDGCPE